MFRSRWCISFGTILKIDTSYFVYTTCQVLGFPRWLPFACRNCLQKWLWSSTVFRNGKNFFLFEQSLDWKIPELIRLHASHRPTLVFCSTRKRYVPVKKKINRIWHLFECAALWRPHNSWAKKQNIYWLLSKEIRSILQAQRFIKLKIKAFEILFLLGSV